MSFQVGLGRTFPGYGVGVKNDLIYVQNGIALSTTGQQTKTIPATGVILGTSAGKIRIKIYNGGGTTPAIVDILVQASDGTNLINIFEYHPSVALLLSTTLWFDRFFEYLLDVASVSANAGGAHGQLLPGGATSFNVLTTLSGTTPTASMDLEIIPLV